MSVAITQLHPVFVGEVTGIDMCKPMTPQEVAAIEAGMDRYAVLIFHDQNISDEQQLAFTRNFGPIQDGTNTTRTKDLRLASAFADVSNLDQDNRVFTRDDRRRVSSLGNRLWHSDASFRPVPARYSLLSGRIVPPSGGNTEFADMRAAYDALEPKTKALIEDLVCEHSRIFSKGALGFSFTEEEMHAFAPVRQRLVRTHRKTGRKSLYLSSHAGRILGWPVPEAMLLLRELTEHATQREFVYSHRWREGDLVMWDNRQLMHRARRYEDERYPRDLRRTTLTDGLPTVEEQSALAAAT